MKSRRNEFYKSKGVDLKPEIFENLHKEYGCSLRGLRVKYGFNFEFIPFLNYVSENSKNKIIINEKENTELINILKTIKKNNQNKIWLFTNGTKLHSDNILNHLNIKKYFDGFINANMMNDHKEYLNKPHELAFEFTEKELKFDKTKDKIYFFDDSARNILCAYEKKKWNCFYVNTKKEIINENIITLSSILEIKNHFSFF